MDPYQVIKTISVTEKSADLTEFNKYTFIVHVDATKPQIKRAVKELFEREVDSVNVMNRMGKARRTRQGAGRRADWKKAIVTLKEDEEPIEFF